MSENKESARSQPDKGSFIFSTFLAILLAIGIFCALLNIPLGGGPPVPPINAFGWATGIFAIADFFLYIGFMLPKGED